MIAKDKPELVQKIQNSACFFFPFSGSKRKAASGEAEVDRGEPGETETGDD